MIPSIALHRHARSRTIALVSVALLLSPNDHPSARAAMTVTGETVTEGNNPAAPAVARFTLTNAPAATTPTVWEYATSSDTAREGTDYLGRHGAVTIPANESSVVVEVPLVADSQVEAEESFALIVWPQGAGPSPSLTEIPKPSPVGQSSFEWQEGPIAVNEERWLMNGRLGGRSGISWPVQSAVATPAESYVGSFKVALAGRWLAATDLLNPLGQFTPRQRVHIYDVRIAGDPLLPLHSLTSAILPAHMDAECLVANSIVAQETSNGVALYQLSTSGSPGLLGVCPVGQAPGRGFAFSGSRLAIPLSNAAQIWDATDVGLASWKLTATIPSVGAPLALEGDALLASRPIQSPAPRTELVVFERNQGGTDKWGEAALLPDVATTYPRSLSMRGALALVPDAFSPPDGQGPGRILVFGRNPANRQWTQLTQFSAPAPKPHDWFGASVALGGRDLVALAPSTAPTSAWAGSLPGAVATIMDDDAPIATLSSASTFESAGGTGMVALRVDLSRAAATPVSFTWRTRNGSATAGTDYAAQASSATIPAGEDFIRLQVPILDDPAVEEIESFFVDVESMSGARLVTASAECRIVDTDRRAVVAAATVEVYEEAPTIQIDVDLFPAGDALEVPWRFITVMKDGPNLPNETLGLVEVGIDVPQASGLLTAETRATRQIPLEASADSFGDFREKGTVAFELPPFTTAATFGTRFIGWPPPVYAPDFGQPTTDGDWVAVPLRPPADPNSTAGFRIYGRNPNAPGGWAPTKLILPAAAGLASWPLGESKLRRGRLLFYDYTGGRAWVFRHDQGGAGQWGLEASFDTEQTDLNAVRRDYDFDGETFVVFRPTTVVAPPKLSVHSFEAGQWQPRQEIFDAKLQGFSTSYRSPSVVGDIIPFLACNPSEPPTVGLLQKNGPPASRWSVSSPIVLEGPPVTTNQLGLQLSNDHLAFGRTGNPGTTTLYRRQPDGSWTPEAVIPDTVALFQPGVFIGAQTWVDSGQINNRWQSVGPTSFGKYWTSLLDGVSGADLQRGVMVSNRGLRMGEALGLVIAEAGAEFIIFDEDTFRFDLFVSPSGFPLGVVEAPNTQSRAGVEVSTRTPVPVDVTIPFRTVAGGTATAGLDYLPVQGVMRIAAGQMAARFVVPLLPDSIRDPSETILIEVGPPSYGVMERSQETLTVGDRAIVLAVPDPPAAVFEPLAGQETFLIPFQLAYPFDENFPFSYRITAKSATAADVTLISGTATVSAGQTTLLVPVTVLADGLIEGTETAVISVTVPGAGVLAPSTTLTAEVLIDDAQTAGGSADTFAVAQGGMLDFSATRNVLSNDAEELHAIQPARPAQFGSVDWHSDGTFRYQPPPNFIGTDRFAYQAGDTGTVVVTDSASWKWLHPLNGQDPETAVPEFQANWKLPTFDDAAWGNGTGLMGYGVLGSGAGQTITTAIGTPTGSRLTAYFRTAFTAPVDSPPGLTVEFACDDAAIFYLNGTELGRYAKGPDPAFLAAADAYPLICLNVHDVDEETAVRTLVFPTAQVLTGSNLLAISLHNQSPGSSDLGLRVAKVSTGLTTTPVRVDVAVADAHHPPVVVDDAYAIQATTTPLDSMLLAEGSAYANDRLLTNAGAPYDPILEAETGGSPIGPVTFGKDTGHFRIAGPAGFFGATSFTYRVRDKDGWSNTAVVSLNVAPSRAFDAWRQATFGGGSANALSEALADGDGDGLVNLIEFVRGTDPTLPNSTPSLELKRGGGAWIAEFLAQPGFGNDVFIGLESSASLTSSQWKPLAWLNDAYPTVETLAPGVTRTTADTDGQRQYSITLPPSLDPTGFFRLRVSRERHAMDP